MNLSDLTKNWNAHLQALAQRFPHSKIEDLRELPERPSEITKVLAKNHDLTINEAREELEDLLFVASLARDTADFRLYDRESIAQTQRVSRAAS